MQKDEHPLLTNFFFKWSTMERDASYSENVLYEESPVKGTAVPMGENGKQERFMAELNEFLSKH